MSRKSLDKATILQAAIELADDMGLEQVTLSSLAQRLGIKSPSLYNHIDGMPGLRRELALHGLQLLCDAMTKAAVGKAGEKALLSIGIAYVAFVREHPGLYEATQPAPDQMDEELVAASYRSVQLLLDVLDEYQLERDDALHMVRGLRSMLHGFASLELRGGFGLKLDTDESLMRMLRTYLSGMELQVRTID
ncbi:TetR/AcrR family transcriptional regulator [Paenibacillus sp. OSY-SE]|uniref:TetR/AcrR family transcriptional regulator n=1 Tax=Paenibacillus sp. OSY-SE TaxID=1196323 RepID=UPI000306B46D|nr:TetR/AcrR family transcriptional regulator [Paenibacillus sp. OSY-SE]